MQSHEAQPQNYDILSHLRESIKNSLANAEKARMKAGQEIRQQVRVAVSKMEKDVIPESMKIADITPISGISPTALFLVEYNSQKNELSVVRKEVRHVEDFTNSPFETFSTPEEGKPRYVSLPEEQQTETTLRVGGDVDWARFGLSVVDALQDRHTRAQGAKKQ